MTRRNRPNAARRARAADARRATVLNLLARLDRGELTPDERQLLRDAITADHAALDTARQAQREHGNAMRRQARQLDAAHDAIREAEQATADAREQLHAHQAIEEHRRRIIAAGTIPAAALLPPSPEACCVCGHGPVTYHNYREQPFCWPCADGQPAPTTSTPEQQP